MKSFQLKETNERIFNECNEKRDDFRITIFAIPHSSSRALLPWIAHARFDGGSKLEKRELAIGIELVHSRTLHYFPNLFHFTFFSLTQFLWIVLLLHIMKMVLISPTHFVKYPGMWKSAHKGYHVAVNE